MQAYRFRFYFLFVTVIIFGPMVFEMISMQRRNPEVSSVPDEVQQGEISGRGNGEN